MKLYDLRNLRSKCEIDVSRIDDKPISSLDEYLYNFPYQKILAYAYLKKCNDSIKLSKLHNLFKRFDDIEYLTSSALHRKRLKNDPVYEKVTARYVRNPYQWISGTLSIQSHFFDAKYLLIGEFQKIAKSCVDRYLSAQLMHYTVPYNKLKMTDVNTHNNWFIERREVESSFFNNLLSRFRFSDKLMINAYWKYIELYDTVSKLTLQIQLSLTKIEMSLLYPNGSGKISKQKSQDQIMTFLQRYREVFSLYQKVYNDREAINEYLEKLEQVNTTHSRTYKLLVATTTQMLQDFHANDPAAYIDNVVLNSYWIHHQSIERTVMWAKNGKLRLYRRLKHLNDKFNRHSDIEYSSYRLEQNTPEEQAIELLHSGFINIGSDDQRHTLYDYELLATGKSNEFALQFLKMTSVDAKSLFDPYEFQKELLDSEVKYLLENNTDAKDTRVKTSKPDDYITTYFEYQAFQNDPIAFNRDREARLQAKRKRIKYFIEQNKTLLNS